MSLLVILRRNLFGIAISPICVNCLKLEGGRDIKEQFFITFQKMENPPFYYVLLKITQSERSVKSKGVKPPFLFPPHKSLVARRPSCSAVCRTGSVICSSNYSSPSAARLQAARASVGTVTGWSAGLCEGEGGVEGGEDEDEVGGAVHISGKFSRVSSLIRQQVVSIAVSMVFGWGME